MSGVSNTASLTTNFNINPYFDDFREDKNFHRILFRPAQAVQARELTQLQTILQNQIDRFAEHIFREGSIVRGCELNYDQAYAYVKIRNSTSAGANVTPSALVGRLVTGGTSGVKAVVVGSADGAEANTPHLKTLFVKYTGSGSAGTTKTFAANEILTANGAGSLSANTATAAHVGYGSAVTVAEGILYAKDHFIRVAPQTLVLDKYSANTTYRVGFTITETIVDPSADSTLLDPASGSYNFAAPGAHRLKLTPTLAKANTTQTSTNNFIEILQTKNGVLQSLSEAPQYSAIRDYLAQRTFDTQGNMVVQGLALRLREHLLSGNNNGVYTAGQGGSATKLSADVAPGKAYVLGYDLETLVTVHVDVDKATDAAFVDTALIPANYGNTLDMDNVVGQWDVNAQGQVSLRSNQANGATTRVFSGGSSPGTQIGTARVRALEYVSGAPGDPAARYRLYLHDITMAAGKSFANVQCATYSAGAGNANGKADIVGSTGLNASISTPSLNRAIFRIPAENIKRLRDQSGVIDNTFKFTKAFDGTFDASGQMSLNTADASETFSGSGSLGATLARSRFYVVMRQSGNTATLTGTANTSSGSNNVICSAAMSSQLTVGDVVQIAAVTGTYTVSGVSVGSFRLLTGAASTQTGKSVQKKFHVGQVIDMGGLGRDGARDINVTSSTTCVLDINETLGTPTTLNATVIAQLNKVDGEEADKTINRGRLVILRLSDNVATTVGPWELGFSDGFRITSVRKKGSAFAGVNEGTDVTSEFILDNGQADNVYNHAKLVKKSTSTLALSGTDYLLVTLDFFTHSYSSGKGYFSVDSYPVDDTLAGSDPTKIYTYEIPVYTSPLDGAAFSLRDCVDIRPRMTDTATNTTVLGSATTNPVVSTSYDQPSGGLHFAWPNTDFNFDLEYYLPRKDILSLTKAGSFQVTKGVPSLLPNVPNGPADAMELATLNIAPYPSLPPETAKQANRPDLSCDIVAAKHPRLTMGDLGSLRNRVEQLEYFTAMSMLEKEAQAMLIADGSGVDRFKNGILVDSFLGHNIGNVFDPDYKISIDPIEGSIRPPVKVEAVELFYSAANSSSLVRTNTTTSGVARDQYVTIANSQALFANGETVTCGGASATLRYKIDNRLVIENATGNFTVGISVVGGTSGASSTASTVSAPGAGALVTLPYSHAVLVNQRYATGTRNPVGMPYVFRGTMTLTPDTDYWMDMATRPEVQANFDATADNWLYMASAWTSIWNGWQTYWTGETNKTHWNELGRSVSQTTTEIAAKKTWKEIRPVSAPASAMQQVGTVRAVDTNIQPFMRGRQVKVYATGLKPSTRYYAFFDGEDVSTYLTPTNSSYVATAAEGAAITSDSAGTVYALFRISVGAALRFRTGRKVFRLTDSSTNNTALGTVTAAAECIYTAAGLSAQADKTFVSTRPYVLAGDSTVPTTTAQSIRPLTGSGQERTSAAGDPLAQSFTVTGFQTEKIIGNGVYLTKVDLYFASKDSSAPVAIEIRELDPVTGYLTPRVLPFSQVVVPASSVYTKSVSTMDEDGNVTITLVPVPTTIYFSAPVFVVNGQSYALVVRPAGNNPNYALFTARLGQNDVVTGNRITAQPAAGNLYVPANDRSFVVVKEEDLSFVLYAATFNTATTGTAVVKNEPTDCWTLLSPSAPFIKVGEAVHGETTFVLNSSLTVNTNITARGNTSLANGSITLSSGTNMRVKNVTLANKFQNGETIHFLHANGLPIKSAGVYVTRRLNSVITPTATVKAYDTVRTGNTLLYVANVAVSNVGSMAAGGGVFVSGFQVKSQTDGLTATVGTIKTFQGDTIQLLADVLQPANTSLIASAKLATSTSAKDTSAFRIPFNEPAALSQTRFILSRSLESNTAASAATMASAKSAEVSIAFSTASRHSSPALDLGRLALITVEHQITSNTVLGSSEDVVAMGGNAEARYITRKVALADGQDAEDLRVYLTAYKHASAGVFVYYKILHREDSDTFTQAKWIPMTQLTSSTVVSDQTNQEDFHEYSYGIPNYSNAYKSGANTTNSNVVEYRNSASARYQGFKYFAIKVVLTDNGDPSVKVPRVLDIRAIALQQ